MDIDEVWMRIKFDGKNIKFLLFKKGKKLNFVLFFFDIVGNFFNFNCIKIDYLWKEILVKESFRNIIEKYV